jgi:hypothetical protein
MPLVKPEQDAPIAAYANRPSSRAIALERVQAASGKVHIVRLTGIVQPEKNVPEALCVLRTNPFPAPGLKEAREPFVAKAPYHASNVTPNVTFVNSCHGLTRAGGLRCWGNI